MLRDVTFEDFSDRKCRRLLALATLQKLNWMNSSNRIDPHESIQSQQRSEAFPYHDMTIKSAISIFFNISESPTLLKIGGL